MNYKAVCFDFDYTLGDATDAICAGFAAGMTALGCQVPPREAIRRTVGQVLEDAYTELSGDRTREGRAQFRARFSAVARPMQAQGVPLCPGAAELITALARKGLATAVVSTKHAPTLLQILEGHGLDKVFSTVIGGDMVSVPKPDPEGLIVAMDAMGVTPGEVLYCGDTVIDAETARRAGVDFCAVLNGTTEAGAFAEYPHVHISPDLWDLKAWLDA